MMRKMRVIVSSEKGFSLVEILAAIVLLAMLVGPFLTMFVQSAKNNQVTQNIDDATFVASSQMELFYQLISASSTSSDSTFTTGLSNHSYQPTTCATAGADTMCFKNTSGSKHYILVELTNKSPLEDVLVKVYQSQAMNHLQAQMESVFAWKN